MSPLPPERTTPADPGVPSEGPSRPTGGRAALVACVLLAATIALVPGDPVARPGGNEAPAPRSAPAAEPALGAPSAPVGPRPARGDQALAGRILDPAGHGIAEALVRAVREDVAGDVPREVRSDAQGAFALAELPAGRWTLRATAAGFGATGTVRDVPGGGPELVLTLAPVARIAGQVMGVDGAPVAGAEIVLAGSGVWPARTLETGADGRFVLEDVPPGVYEVQARASAGAAPPRRGLVVEAGGRAFLTFHIEPGATMLGRVIDAETGAPIAGAEIVVAEGALSIAPRALRSGSDGGFRVAGLGGALEHHVTVHAEGYVPVVGARWSPGEPLRVTMERGAVLSGIVLDARRRPIEGARLEVLGESGDRQPIALDGASVAFRQVVFRAHEEGLGAGPPAALGALEVTSEVPPIPLAAAAYEPPGAPAAVPSGRPAIAAVASGFVTGADGTFRIQGVPPGHVQIVARKAGLAPGSSERVWVGPGRERERIEIVLEPSGRIEGEVVDERGEEVARVMIEHRSDAEPWPRVTVSDERGRFVLEDVAGAVTVRANVAGRPPVQARVDVRSGGRERVRLVVPAPGPRIEGTTVDERGREVGGVQVRLESMAPGESAPRVVISDDWGRFAIDDAPSGPWRASADHMDYAQGEPVDVDAAGGALRLVVRAGASVRGRVVDVTSGAAIEGAEVVLERAEGAPLERRSRTGAEGAFVIPRALPARYAATVRAAGFAAWRGEVVVRASRAGEIEIGDVELARGARLEGDVVDALGAVVRGATVGVEGDPARSARTDAQGHFALDGLVAGSFVIRAAHPAAGEVSRAIVVRASHDPAPVVLRLPSRYRPDDAQSERALRRGVAIEVGDAEGGVRIVEVGASSRAAQAGLRGGDVLRAIDGAAVDHAGDAERLLRGADGVSAVLDVERDGEVFRVRVAREAW